METNKLPTMNAVRSYIDITSERQAKKEYYIAPQNGLDPHLKLFLWGLVIWISCICGIKYYPHVQIGNIVSGLFFFTTMLLSWISFGFWAAIISWQKTSVSQRAQERAHIHIRNRCESKGIELDRIRFLRESLI